MISAARVTQQEQLGCREVSLRRQHKIDRVARGIHRSVQIRPLTGDANVRLIYAPGTIGSPELAAKPLIQNGRETLDPTPDRDMAHGETALCRYFLQIAVTEGIPQVLADTPYDDFVLEVSSAE